MIYSTLIEAGFTDIHKGNNFRFFTYSDVFPTSLLKADTVYNLIISSPRDDLVNGMLDVLLKNMRFYLSDFQFQVIQAKAFNLRLGKEFITGSPVVLYLDNRHNEFYSIRDKDPISFFLRRIKENAIKKFSCFYHEDMQMNHLIFDSLKFHREVSMPLHKGKKDFNIIGSTWYSIKINRINNNEFKFYKFLMDTGIGEKNSLGFGFLNPVAKNE